MSGEPGAKGAAHPSAHEGAQGQDIFGLGGRERDDLFDWMSENLTLVRRTVSGQRPLYWILGIGFVVGLAAHTGGFLLKTSATTEPLLLVADLLYALGWAMWTSVVVVFFVQIWPEAKKRQYKQALDAYQAAVSDQARAADAGNTSAMVNLGVLLRKQGQHDQAEQWYRKAADGGNTAGMYHLGAVLAEQGEEDQAEQWYRQAADGGNVAAMVNLGAVLRKQGQQDQAEQWYRKAAGAGNTDAMINLAVLLAEKDADEAVQWFRKAADAGRRAGS